MKPASRGLLSILRLLVFSVVLVGSLLLFSFRGGDSYNSIKDRVIVLRLASDPKSFNPIVAQETSTTAVTSLLFEGLVKIDPFTQQPLPNLAWKWEASEDGRRWRFYLRKGLKWSDGVPLTAEDVAFTFNSLIFNPSIPNSAREIFTIDDRPIKVEVRDKYTIDFVLPDRFAPFLEAMTQDILPKHVLKPIVDKGGFNSAWSLSVSPSDVVCNGPYRLKRFVPGQFVELRANPYYWHKDKDGSRLPHIPEVVMMIIPSDDTALIKFLEGELDFLSLRPMDYILLKKRHLKDVLLINLGPSLGTNFLVFNQNPSAPIPEYKLKWFSNIRFRQAIAHLIDREGIIRTIYSGLGQAQYGPLSEANGFFYSPELCRYRFDKQKAIKLLVDMGFRDRNGDGVLEDEAGHRLTLSLVTNANSSERVQMASIIARDMRAVGIDLRYIGIDFNDLVTRLTASFDWETVLIGLTGGFEPHFGKNVWFSKGPLHIWYPGEKQPATHWEREVDEIFETAVKELDREKRKSLYSRWQKIISCRLPVIYTVTPFRLFALRDRFVGIKPSPYGGVLHNIAELKIKTK